MKIARFAHAAGIGFGPIDGDRVFDIAPALPGIPDLVALIELAQGDLPRLLGSLRRDRGLALTKVRLLCPMMGARKYLGLGGNYREHRRESAAAAQAGQFGQIWFNKQISCLHDPFGDVWIPRVSQQLDYEGELGVVIGRPAFGVKASQAAAYVAGYLVCNDFSLRDMQARSPTHTLGKSFDTHGPVGPWLTTVDEVGSAPDLALQTLVNGQIRQQSRTSSMIASIGEMIEELSAAFTLQAGDILATGTPAGIGKAMNPPTWLRPGDVVRVEIEGLGHLENRIVAQP